MAESLDTALHTALTRGLARGLAREGELPRGLQPLGDARFDLGPLIQQVPYAGCELQFVHGFFPDALIG